MKPFRPMTPSNVPRKSAAVYRRGDHYFVDANSMTDAGAWIASLPATLVPVSASGAEIGAVVSDARAAGAVGVPSPSRERFSALPPCAMCGKRRTG